MTPRVSPQEIRRHLSSRFDFRRSVPLETLIPEVADLMRCWWLRTAHPRYFGLFNRGVRPASVTADAPAVLYNPQMAAWSHAPAAIEIERFTLGFLLPRIGIDP